jgi:hypothetical protein
MRLQKPVSIWLLIVMTMKGERVFVHTLCVEDVADNSGDKVEGRDESSVVIMISILEELGLGLSSLPLLKPASWACGGMMRILRSLDVLRLAVVLTGNKPGPAY